jgi:hypothetical protein
MEQNGAFLLSWGNPRPQARSDTSGGWGGVIGVVCNLFEDDWPSGSGVIVIFSYFCTEEEMCDSD